MRPLLVFAAACFALASIGVATTAQALAALGAVGVAYVALCYLLTPPGGSVRATRELVPPMPEEGERVRAIVTLIADRPVFARATDRVPEDLDRSTLRGSISFAGKIRGKATFEYSFVARRGPLRFRDVECACYGPLFGASRIELLPCPTEAACAPAEGRPIEFSLRARRTLAYAGGISSRTAGAGDEFFLVREYRRGDALRRVNWRRSAGSDELFVNDFERRRNADIGFVLDTRETPTALPDRDEDLDAAARLETALAEECARQGHRISHMTFGVPYRYVTPGHGRRQARLVRATLALAEPSAPQSLEALASVPDSVFPHQSTLVLFLKILGDEEGAVRALVSKGYRVTVVVSGIEAAASRARAGNAAAAAIADYERESSIAAMRACGAIVYEFDPAKGHQVAATDLGALLALAARGAPAVGGRR